jgi:o-succinylbenzoate synthase
MKIDRVNLHHVALPYVRPFQTSRWTEHRRDAVLVELQADGLTGWGECVASGHPFYTWETVKTNWHVLEDYIVPTVLAGEIPDIESYVRSVAFVHGHPMAKAGMEMALWDLFGKRSSRSLQAMLGGKGDRVRVGVSVGIQESPEALLDLVNQYLSEGYGRVKLKVKPGRDESEVSIVRRHYPQLALQVDANSVYRIGDAEHLRRIFDDKDLLLVEQPFSHDDLVDHAKLQKTMKTPVCLDETIVSLDHARWALELGSCRIINIKPGRTGGMTEGKRIHDLCLAHGVPVWMGGMLETGIGRAANVAMASLPGFTLPGDVSATSRYFREDVTEQTFVLNPDSTLSVPQGPGLGVEIDRAALRRASQREGSHKA